MVVHVEVRTSIRRPIDDVFRFITDLERLPEWVGIVQSCEKTSEGPVGVGTTIREDVKVAGMRHVGTAEITQFEPPHGLEQRFEGGPLRGTITVRLSEQDRCTEILQAVEAVIEGFLKPPDSMLASLLTREFQGDLDRLKDLLEAPPPR